MFKIEGKTIHCTRGDRGTIKFSAETCEGENYVFKVGDKVIFAVKPKKGFSSEEYSMRKEIEVLEETEQVDIELTGEDTSVGELINKPTTYWYEISLNSDQTIIGYDEDGAKEFILYPEGDE